jgi:teichuronic acid biosynthesis glycosyltransferase TuaC
MRYIVCISHLFPSPGGPTAGLFVADQTSALLEGGVNVKVICPIPTVPFALSHVKPKWEAYYRTPRAAVLNGVPTTYVRWLCLPYRQAFSDSGRLMANALWADRSVRGELAEAAVLHGHTLVPDGDCVRRLAVKFGLRYIVTVHGSDLTVYPSRDRLTFLASKRVMDEATEIIFVSQYLADFAMSRFAIDPRKVRVIGNGFDPKVFHQGELPHDTSLRFLYVGDLKREKGLLDLVQAIQEFRTNEPELFKRADFTLVGEGGDRASVEAAIASAHLKESVHLLGGVPHKEVADHMRASDLLVLPSWSEGLPTVIPEALACGLPIIATTVGGIPEIVNRANGCLVAPKRPSELARALAQAATCEWDRDAIAAMARPYRWSSVAERLRIVYENAEEKDVKHERDR